MNQEQINNLIILGERLSNNVVYMIEKDMVEYAAESIREILDELEKIIVRLENK